MIKYPFTKKAMSIMLATALVVTPLAATAPIGGVQVSAAEVEASNTEQQIHDLSQRMINFYKNDNRTADATILQQSFNKIGDFSIAEYPTKVDSTKEGAFLELIKETGKLFYSSYTSAGELEDAIVSYRESQSKNYQDLFNGTVTTAQMIEFFGDLETKVNSPGFVIELLSGTYEEAILKAVENTRDTKYDDLDGRLTEALGIGLTGLFRYEKSFNSSVDPNGDARSELLKTAVAAPGKSSFVIEGTKQVNNEQRIILKVMHGGISPSITSDVTWKITNPSGVVNTLGEDADKFIPTMAGEYTVTAHLKNDEDLRIASKKITISSPNTGGGTPPPTDPTPDPEPIPNLPDRPGTSVDAGNTTTVERETTSTGIVKAITKVDSGKLAEVLANNPTADRVKVQLERVEGELAELRLPKEAVLALLNSPNKNLIIDVETDTGSISIPVNELSEDKIRQALQLGEEAEFTINISANPATAAETEIVNGKLSTSPKGLSNKKSEVVDFSLTVSSGERQANISNFSSYVYREIPIDNVENLDNVVVLNVDGEPTVVPTQTFGEAVRFASFTFSKYVVVEREPVIFKDLPNTFWAKPEIDRLSVRDIFQGRENGTVAPNESVTRIQLAVLLSRALGLVSSENYENQFKDVAGDEWFMAEFLPVIEAGIVQGRQDGTFSPNEKVTRQQAAAMISRAMEHIGVNESKLDATKSLTQYPDVNRIGDWAQTDVERLLQAGIMEGKESGEFDPKESTTRAQMAKMLDRLLKVQDLMN
ncbi:S-layer homology domain-containing protein [Bacillus solitudinis]|uniref:S-layer homology domain-containing protein n=1 Tax=Bacillus solitudinis TaxID=2014074 RepID=UPI000C24613C|nr:S-layer homology domain-containing protein [Bacillus solitudinis]